MKHRIKEILQERGIKVAEFAKMMEIAPSTAYTMLKGTAQVFQIKKAAEVLGVDYAELMLDPEEEEVTTYKLGGVFKCPHCGEPLKLESLVSSLTSEDMEELQHQKQLDANRKAKKAEETRQRNKELRELRAKVQRDEERKKRMSAQYGSRRAKNDDSQTD